MTQPIEDLAKEIQKYGSFLLAGHINPEGDCVGSVLAVERLLGKLGKRSQIYYDGPLPPTLAFLEPGSWKSVTDFKTPPEAEAVICVDVPSWERLGRAAEVFKKKPVINIDHHVSNHNFGHFNFIDPKAAACGEIIFELYQHLKIPIDLETARCLYVSISTDTGSFRYSNTTPKTLRIAASLVEAGINVERINQEIYGEYEDTRLRLLEVILKERKFAYEKRLAYAVLSYETLKATGARPDEMEGLIDALRGLKTTKACFIVTEWRKGVPKVSFRSSSDLDVNKIASRLNGGGHAKAAGATLEGLDPQTACQKILDLFKSLFS
jgi:phosphoesterase RecJ-like protein